MKSFQTLIDELIRFNGWDKKLNGKEQTPVQTELDLGEIVPKERYGCIDLYLEEK